MSRARSVITQTCQAGSRAKLTLTDKLYLLPAKDIDANILERCHEDDDSICNWVMPSLKKGVWTAREDRLRPQCLGSGTKAECRRGVVQLWHAREVAARQTHSDGYYCALGRNQDTPSQYERASRADWEVADPITR